MRKLKLFFACLLMAVLSIGQVWGAEQTVSWNASSGALGSAISSVNGTAQGTISTGSFSWNYTRTLAVLTSGKSDYISMSGSYMQLGSSNAGENVEFRTSNIPGTIKSVTVLAGSKDSRHTGTITVGGTDYNAGAISAWASSAGGNWEGTGSSSGEIVISIACNSKKSPIYIASITVVYEEGAPSCTSEITITKGDNPANGTFVIDNSGTVCIDEGNATVNVTATPNAGYHLATVTSTVGTVGDIDGNNCAITNISANTTINVTFAENPKYTVSFNVGGSSASQADITEASAGAGITLPAGPTPACSADGWTFAGWKETSAVAEQTTTAPTLLAAGANYKPASDCILYAVYKRTESGAVTDQDITETFEDQEAGSTYNSTINYEASASNANIAWTMYYGTVSTNDKIADSKSAQMRWYSSAKSNIPYVLTTTPISGLQSVNFKARVSNTGVKMSLWYSTDGENWTISDVNQATFAATNTAYDFSATITGTVGTNYYIKIGEDGGTAPSSGNYKLIIDAVQFNYKAGASTTYYLSAPTCAAPTCENLGTPSVTVTNKTYNSAKLTWAAVENADKYLVKFNGVDQEATGNLYFDATNLDAETQYTYQVKALAEEGQDDWCDGAFSAEANFTTEAAPEVQLWLVKKQGDDAVNGGTHTLGVEFNLTPSDVACDKEFVGWTTADYKDYTHATDAPAVLLNKYTFTSNEAVTLYAVYGTPGASTYVATTFAEIPSGSEVVITGNNGDMYAMSSDKGASAAPTAVAISETATAGVLDVEGKSNIFWVLSKDGDNFSFTKVGSEDKLYCTGDNNGVRVGSGANNVFSMSSNYMFNNGASAYVGIYNSADWRRYGTINSNIQNQTFAFYKKNTIYSNYATTCALALAKPSFNEEAGTYNVVKSIELSADEGDIHYTTNGDDPDENSPVYSTAIALNDCGSTTIKAIAIDGDRVSEMAEATYVIKLPIDANTEEGAYTAAQAKAIIDEGCDLTSQQVYVKGTVQVPNYYESSHTYTITLAGEEGFQFYKLYDLNGAEFTSDYIKAGDQIVAYGYLKKHNATYELDQNCYLVSYEEYTEPKTDIDNTIDNPWTVAQADGFMDAPAQYDLEDVVFVKGVVTGFATNKVIIRDTENGEEYIELYKSTLADGISALIAGDLIIATGTLNKYQGTTYQMNQGCQVVWKKAKATIEIADINMEVGDEIELSSIAATITPEAAESATINYEVTEGTAVSISEGKIIAAAAGEATITASIATTEDYIGASKEITVTVTAPDTRKIANASAFEAISGDMTPADIAFAAYKGDGTTTPVINSSNIRLYKPATGKNTGSYLTLTAKVGCTIDQVKITFAANATAAYSVDDAALPTEAFITGQTELLTSAGLNAQSVSVVNLKNGSIDVSEIKVWYTGDALAVDHYILGGTYATEFEQYGEFNFEGLTVTAAYDELETITEAVTGFTVEADLSTAGEKKAYVYLDDAEIAQYDITVTPTAKSDPEIGWSPADNIVMTEGDEFTAPTWQNPHSVSVSFESTNTSVATVSNAGVITIKGVGTATISATFDGDETYYSANPSITVTVNAAVEDLMGNWVVASSVAAGDRIIIANVAVETTVKTMGAQNGSYRDEVASTVSNNIMTPADGTKVFTLIDASTIDANYTGFALRATNGKYLSAASSSSNNIKEVASVSDANAVWNIVISEGKAAIVAQGSYSRKVIRYNSSQPRFSCYAESNDMKDVVIYKRAFDYEREIAPGVLSTTCLPNGGVIYGASIFEVAYMDYEADGTTPHKIYFDEVEGGIMEAGVPYIVLANEGSDKFGVYYSDNENKAAQSKKGLVGYMGDGTYLAEDDYFIYNNMFYHVSAADANTRVHISSNRAYINLSDVPGYNNVPVSVPAPRRRVSLGNGAPKVATGIDALNASDKPVKMIIDGQLFIIRGEKMFNANGQLVK